MQQEIILSRNNRKHTDSILEYGNLEKGWDSYGANRPSSVAIAKATSFIAEKLASRGLEVFYTVPTPDGDVLVELKAEGRNLEFIFSETDDNKIIASSNGELCKEDTLNDATFHSCLNWLYAK